MAICGTCKAESARIRTHWTETGSQVDECPACAPSSFEKFTDPSDKKIWAGYEAHPNEYEKRYDKDGVIYERKPEYRAEQEEKLQGPTEEESETQARAVAKKRAERRTDPMDSVELAAALHKAEEIAGWLHAASVEGKDIN
jgi:hypothetical protein